MLDCFPIRVDVTDLNSLQSIMPQRTFQLVRLETLLEASKLTILFLKGRLVALCIFKLNCKQRLTKE